MFSSVKEKEIMMENLIINPQESLNIESIRSFYSKHGTILNCSDNEYCNQINLENNSLIYENIRDSISSFNNPTVNPNNPNCVQKITEQRKLKDIDEKILKEIEEENQKINKLLNFIKIRLIELNSIRNKIMIEEDEKDKAYKVILNTNKNELNKGIIKLDNDIKNYQTIYNSLNPVIQTALRDKYKKLEEFLKEVTYIKNQILENEIIIKPPDYPNIKVDNNIKLKDFNDYSFNCLTKNLNFTIKKGTSEAKFKLIFENDGEFPWPKNKTILSTDKSKSNIKIQDILMEPLNPQSKCTFDIKFRNMGRLQKGKYYSYLDFKVEGKKYGNSILVNVEVIDDIKTEYKPIIDVVREEYNLDKNMASDTMIARGIDKTKTIEGAFNFIVENKK